MALHTHGKNKKSKSSKASKGQQIAKGVGAILTAAGKSFKRNKRNDRDSMVKEGELSGPAKSIGNIVSSIGKAVTKRKVKKKAKRGTFHK